MPFRGQGGGRPALPVGVALIGVVALPVLVVAVKGKAGRIVAPAPARK